MKWYFWLSLVLCFLLVNEYLSNFFSHVFAEDMSLASAYKETFRYSGWVWSIQSYALFAAFRALPYTALAWLAARSKLSSSISGRIALWVTLLALAAFHFYGYWLMQVSLSSTSAILGLWIPIFALIYGIVGYAIFYVFAKIVGYFRQRWLLQNKDLHGHG
ncbi:hypothetical protein ACR0ST_00625 [Aliidiomarina sp. Khilg15.8]